jgi:hypothetical protein
LEIDDKLRQDIHSLDKPADVACAALFDRQVVVDLAASGDLVPAVISGQLDQVITRKLFASGLVVSKWLYKIKSLSELDAIQGYRELIWF